VHWVRSRRTPLGGGKGGAVATNPLRAPSSARRPGSVRPVLGAGEPPRHGRAGHLSDRSGSRADASEHRLLPNGATPAGRRPARPPPRTPQFTPWRSLGVRTRREGAFVRKRQRPRRSVRTSAAGPWRVARTMPVGTPPPPVRGAHPAEHRGPGTANGAFVRKRQRPRRSVRTSAAGPGAARGKPLGTPLPPPHDALPTDLQIRARRAEHLSERSKSRADPSGYRPLARDAAFAGHRSARLHADPTVPFPPAVGSERGGRGHSSEGSESSADPSGYHPLAHGAAFTGHQPARRRRVLHGPLPAGHRVGVWRPGHLSERSESRSGRPEPGRFPTFAPPPRSRATWRR